MQSVIVDGKFFGSIAVNSGVDIEGSFCYLETVKGRLSTFGFVRSAA